MVEMTLLLPVLVLLMLGAADLGRAFYFSIEITGATRAGMRTGIIGSSMDVGKAVRNEPFNAIDNSVAVWGATGPGQPYDGCGTAGAACGDPGGCASSAFTGSRVACFAVRTCTIDAVNGGCVPSSYSPWGNRPAQASAAGLQVRVVYKFTPFTPLVASMAGADGVFYLRSETTGVELY
jgi:hypothetical protein